MIALMIPGARYAKENGTYGITTLLGQHVKVEGGQVRLSFVGMSGKRHEKVVGDRELADLIKLLSEGPGVELFRAVGENGRLVDIEANELNDYLGGISGGEFTAKDFRTWHGTVAAARALLAAGPAPTAEEAESLVLELLAEAH